MSDLWIFCAYTQNRAAGHFHFAVLMQVAGAAKTVVRRARIGLFAANVGGMAIRAGVMMRGVFQQRAAQVIPRRDV